MQKIWKFHWKNERNCRDQISYHRFQIYEINNQNCSNIFIVAKFLRAGVYVDELTQIMKAFGTPGVARVIITLSRIMLLIKLENHVIM